MLCNNNSYANYIRFFSGRDMSLADSYKRNNSTICNAGLFDSKTSFPQGYIYEGAICMPIKTSYYISTRLICEGIFNSNAYTIEEGISTFSGEGTIIANGSTAEAMNSTLSGEGDFSSSAIVVEVLSAVLDAGARPSAFDIAQEVWQSQKTSYQTVGTMGRAVNDAGSAGNPWEAQLDINNTEGTFGKLVQDTKKDVGDAQALILAN